MSARALPHPLPGSIRIGTDIAHLPRFAALVARPAPFLRRWLARNLHPRELDGAWPVLRRWDARAADDRRAALATFLAGRWAIKEATIKAHSRRRLFPSDVVIKTGRHKPAVLVAPPPQLVTFSAAVAAQRGLAGFAPQAPGSAASKSGVAAARVRRPPLAAFRAADASLSHDGDYAFAVVQALDVPHPLAAPAAPLSHADAFLATDYDQTAQADAAAAAAAGGYVPWSAASLLGRATRARAADDPAPPCLVDDGRGGWGVHVPLLGDDGAAVVLGDGVLEAFLEGAAVEEMEEAWGAPAEEPEEKAEPE